MYFEKKRAASISNEKDDNLQHFVTLTNALNRDKIKKIEISFIQESDTEKRISIGVKLDEEWLDNKIYVNSKADVNNLLDTLSEVKAKVSTGIIVSLITLHFPTNWLILLPEK